ncbi:ZPR1 zinc finger domain-containing protein [Candidatus Woesearchaeota archaeon]|nr:MAG: ZPR1 zinc finger domain-containing protein [Candidatus Woesearchaeota archaeon]
MAEEKIEGQQCPMCKKPKLTLAEKEMEIPYFGKVFLFSMNCSECGYHKADVEPAEEQEPCKYELEISKEDDMKIRVVKSSEATVKIPHVGTISPGPSADGYVTNVEGIFQRIKEQIETIRDDAEEKSEKKKAKNLLKKITRIIWGQEKAKLILEDPTGNSAIISEKAKKIKL